MNSENKKLAETVSEYGKVAVALSGGLDSSALLAFCADVLGAENCLAVTARSPYMMASETARSESLCRRLGAEWLPLDFQISEQLRNNPPERCYICKNIIFSKIKEETFSRGFKILCDGTNADDLSDYRPGMRALKELEVASPFLECGIGKSGIREIAAQFGIAATPACACLLTRIEHGETVSEDCLRRIDEAENFIKTLGFENIRVRLHGGCARIETDKSYFDGFCSKNIFSTVHEKLKDLGFKYVSLDLNGYERGSMNFKK